MTCTVAAQVGSTCSSKVHKHWRSNKVDEVGKTFYSAKND